MCREHRTTWCKPASREAQLLSPWAVQEQGSSPSLDQQREPCAAPPPGLGDAPVPSPLSPSREEATPGAASVPPLPQHTGTSHSFQRHFLCYPQPGHSLSVNNVLFMAPSSSPSPHPQGKDTPTALDPGISAGCLGQHQMEVPVTLLGRAVDPPPGQECGISLHSRGAFPTKSQFFPDTSLKADSKRFKSHMRNNVNECRIISGNMKREIKIKVWQADLRSAQKETETLRGGARSVLARARPCHRALH